jgi:beta-lactamase class A
VYGLGRPGNSQRARGGPILAEMSPPRRSIRPPALVAATASVLAALPGCLRDDLAELETDLRARIAQTQAEVGLYYRNLATGDSLLFRPDLRMHAASMMKVPVMIQLYRDAEAGRLGLDDGVVVRDTFRSIADGSAYSLNPEDDSETALYGRLGRKASVRELIELMIARSSNLATNILIELVDGRRVTQTMRELGADSINVLRGVEDIPAYERGLNNTTTARDLGVIFRAIAEHRAASPTACEEMLEILEGQEFTDGIPAGLPDDVPVAHKTGFITGINHDGGVVRPPGGDRYVLVVLIRGATDATTANRLIAEFSRMVYRHVSQ